MVQKNPEKLEKMVEVELMMEPGRTVILTGLLESDCKILEKIYGGNANYDVKGIVRIPVNEGEATTYALSIRRRKKDA